MALSHNFPLLNIEQIVSTCKDIQIPVSENDIRKPDIHRWNFIYSAFFEVLSGVSADQVRQQQLHMPPICSNPELHEESLPLMTFTLAMQRVMCACAFPDFNIKDIIDPKPKRLIKILSAAINFYHFRQTRFEVFDALKSKNERYREQRDYLLKSNDEIKQRVSKLKAIRAEQDPEIRKDAKQTLSPTRSEQKHRLEACAESALKLLQSIKQEVDKETDRPSCKGQDDIEVLDRHVCENHKVQGAVQKNVTELKMKIAEKKAAQDQLKLSILTHHQSEEKLSQKIVQSPERVRQEQERMEQKLSALKMTLDGKQMLSATRSTEHKHVTELEACAERALRLLQSIKQDVDKETDVESQMAASRDRHQELQQTLGELSTRQDQLKHMLAHRQEKRTKLGMQHQSKMAAYQDQLAQFSVTVMSQCDGQDDEKRKLHQARQQMLSELHAEEKAVVGRVEHIHRLYSEIVNMVDTMHLNLGDKWASFRDCLTTYLTSLTENRVTC